MNKELYKKAESLNNNIYICRLIINSIKRQGIHYQFGDLVRVLPELKTLIHKRKKELEKELEDL